MEYDASAELFHLFASFIVMEAPDESAAQLLAGDALSFARPARSEARNTERKLGKLDAPTRVTCLAGALRLDNVLEELKKQFELCWPVMLTFLLSMLLPLTNVVYVGHYLTTSEVGIICVGS